MIDRRTFVGAASGVLLTLPLAIEAQPAAKVPLIGYSVQNDAESTAHLYLAFLQGFHKHGWVDGQNIVIESRFADGKVDRLPALIAELIRLKVDIIVTGSSAATWAAKNATQSIPIVMTASADAPGEGLVDSLSRPGGNVTGMTFLDGPEIAGKQLQLQKEVAPAASRVAVLAIPTNRSHVAFAKELKTAKALDMTIPRDLLLRADEVIQ